MSWRVLRRKCHTAITLAPLVLVGFPGALLLRLLSPFLLIHLIPIRSDRIGRFHEPELYLCFLQLHPPSYRFMDIFYFRDFPICNQQIAVMWARTVRLWSWVRWVDRVSRTWPDGARYTVELSHYHRDVAGWLAHTPIQIGRSR